MSIKRWLVIFAVILLALHVMYSCSWAMLNAMTADRHRQLFFPFISTNAIESYQYQFHNIRGGYATIARVKLKKDFVYAYTNAGYQLISSSERNDGERADLVFLAKLACKNRASSQTLPEWVDVDQCSGLLEFYQRQKNMQSLHASQSFDLFLDADRNVIYFTGMGSRQLWRNTVTNLFLNK
jgi:hypothetical protein